MAKVIEKKVDHYTSVKKMSESVINNNGYTIVECRKLGYFSKHNNEYVIICRKDAGDTTEYIIVIYNSTNNSITKEYNSTDYDMAFEYFRQR